MSAYYNDNNPAAVYVLRHMIKLGVIAPGEVDDRDINLVHGDDLKGFTQCHFFAGGGFWSIAARAAGWPDDRPIWSASLPCQPFSQAGRQLGEDDPRHLWPHFRGIIRTARPAVIVGEQVAGKAGYDWFNGVRIGLARENYISRSVDFPACAVNAPHKRNRQYWAAINMDNPEQSRLERHAGHGDRDGRAVTDRPVTTADDRELADANGERQGTIGRDEREIIGGSCQVGTHDGSVLSAGSDDTHGSAMADAESINSGRDEPQRGPERRAADGRVDAWGSVMGDNYGPRTNFNAETSSPRTATCESNGYDGQHESMAPGRNYWAGAEWIRCHDQKYRRAQPGIRFLVDGLPGRVDLWSIGGNAIVPEAARLVIEALRETLDA